MSFTTYIDMGELGEHEVDVEFDYTPGCSGSHDEPPSFPEVEITKVIWRGMDILSVCSKYVIDQMTDDAFDDINGAAEQAQEDAAEARYFDREAA